MQNQKLRVVFDIKLLCNDCCFGASKTYTQVLKENVHKHPLVYFGICFSMLFWTYFRINKEIDIKKNL